MLRQLVGPAAAVSGWRAQQSVRRNGRVERPAPRRPLRALADHRLGDEHSRVGRDHVDVPLLFVLYVLLRRRSLAIAAMILGLTAIYVVGSRRVAARQRPGRSTFAPSVADIALFAVVQTAIVLVAVRFGLLTMLVASFVSVLLTLLPIAIDSSVPYASSSRLIVATVIGLAAYGWHTALAGRPMFGALFLRDEPARHA